MKLPSLSLWSVRSGLLTIAFLGVGFLLLTTSGCALRSDPSPEEKLEALFRQADRNGDGRVSRAEFTALMIDQAFTWMDTEHNGFITQEEFLAAGGTAAQFRSLDRGQKGYFTVEDVQANPGARRLMALPFDGADKTGDGYVTWPEFQEYRARAAAYIN